MLSRSKIDEIAGVVRSAAASMEAQFLDIGGRLATAVDVIGTLSETFDLLSDELQGDNLVAATDDLSRIMSRVSALTEAGALEREAVARLVDLTATVQQRVLLMGKAVSGIGMLAINARIEAASIGEAGSDFTSFASEISNTLTLAQVSLQHLTKELGGVGNQLRTAAASQLTLTQHQTTALRDIPNKLDASISAIRDCGRRAVAATSGVTRQTQHVAQRISSAVAALQIGDITRQRLEHVEYALGIAGEILVPPQSSRGRGQDGWTEMSDPQRHGVVDMCCRLQSAQLMDAADEFDQEVGRILNSIQALAADAKEILRLGNVSAGAPDGGRGTFLVEIAGPVAEVSDLLGGLGQARREADDVATAVFDATTRLVSHASALRLLEGDIRIMGLNTSLKCGRLGSIGRPLMVIAQELRTYANQIALDAGAVTLNLDNMVVAAGSLSCGNQKEKAGDIAAVGTAMASSISRLEAAGQSLVTGLDTLAHDTESVSGLLVSIVARSTGHEKLGQGLREAAADLARVVANDEGTAAGATADEDRMLGLLMHNYTMARERMVHDQHSNGRVSAITPVATPSITSLTLDDELANFFF